MSLVSVIIPCYNAEKWLAEAINSVLAQTYTQIEIIVIDDGSSDGSLNIIKSYDDKIIWRTGKNQGANKARNLGFAVSQGDYIQYLDADDYLLPDKIAKQLQCLQTTSADFVYSDWRYQHHLENGEIHLSEVQVCGDKDDYLQSLLANDRWSNLAPISFGRSILQNIAWDETLSAAQDRDFLFSVMIAGAKPIYLSGCDSIYRTYPSATVSTGSKLRWIEAHCEVMEKAEKQLRQKNLWNSGYQQALANSYLEMGKEYLYSPYHSYNKTNTKISFNDYAAILDKVYKLAPNLLLQGKSAFYQLVYSLIGYKATENISYVFYSQKAALLQKIQFFLIISSK